MERKSVPVRRVLGNPQTARGPANNFHMEEAGQSRAAHLVLTKVQRSGHKHHDVNHQIRAKPDLNTTLPVRQTASIFKQPVTKVTNHPSNKVKTDPQRAVDQPKQLFWERKLSGLSAFDIADELVKTMDLPKGLQGDHIWGEKNQTTLVGFQVTPFQQSWSFGSSSGVGPASSDKTLLSAIASALHTSPAPVTGQLTAAVEKNPGVWLNTTQPLCKAFVVTDEDIRKQEDLVQSVRRRLEEALMADMLAHVEDAAVVAAPGTVENDDDGGGEEKEKGAERVEKEEL